MAPQPHEEEYNEFADLFYFRMHLLEMITFDYPYSESIDAAQIYKKVTSVRSSGVLLILLAFFNNFSCAIFFLCFHKYWTPLCIQYCVVMVLLHKAYVERRVYMCFLELMQGKKRVALEKLNDPEVWVFVEKCLAAASVRLPARELLMDPFLQCERDHEAIECGPYLLIANCQTDDMGLVWFWRLINV